MTDNLANLLLDHPFGDDRDLLVHDRRNGDGGEGPGHGPRDGLRLLAAGLEPGHGVAIRLSTGPDLVTTMVGIWLAGGVFVPINDRSPDAEVQHVLATVRPLMVRTATACTP